MRELSLQEIQSISLKVLESIHVFCTEHDIKYSLAGGTLIGAIRHQGFIPWDDDIDIMMPRPDYDRFCRMYVSSDRFQLVTQKNSYIPFSRVCECKESYVEPSAVWHDLNVQTGVWVDIFPLDGAYENDDFYDSRVSQLFHVTDVIWLMRKYKSGKCSVREKLNLCSLLCRDGFCSIKTKLKRYDTLCRELEYGSTERFASYTNPIYGKKDRHRMECFSSLIDITFEGRMYKALKGYDEYLTNLYGDYMQLPPVEKRISGHSQHKYYLK